MSEIARKAAHEATAKWLINAGKIGGPGQLHIDRKLSDYDVDIPELISLSQDVVIAFEDKFGKIVKLPADFPHRVSGGTVGNFITAFIALPGVPTTGLDKPIKPSKPR